MNMEVAFPGGKRVDAIYKGFTIKTDQSPHSGGDGSHPAPFDLFLASIGTCVGIYVLVFCQQRNIPTRNLKIILKQERNKETHMIEKINIEISLPPEFPEKYKKAVIRAADGCAVKKHLINPPAFNIYTTNFNQDLIAENMV
ncbi:osmotically inducible protein OsmC [Candidatus Aerophobetes bacterium]|uniref:Osmotically inducible protein OsmC n=1 Tax=Aerophobetes bacterium TaxID=2030807 RepID=A0A662DAQ9_UNCAE|nr:MAG: osmotically inducible protein OsmC [Candidatus Aerophobetes bacterium]